MKTFSKQPDGLERMEPTRCPVCGNLETLPYWECGTFRFERCVVCGHVLQNPCPIQDDLLNRYDEEYKEYEIQNSQQFFNLMLLGLKDTHFFELESEIFKNLGPLEPPKILDIGCATGVLVAYMKDRGWDSKGLEVCEPAARYGVSQRGVEILIGTLSTFDLGKDSFDVIHSSHVIEHVADPGDFLDRQFNFLKPGGRIFITTPNTQSFQAWLKREKWRSAIADHVHLFSRKNLQDLLISKGFVIEAYKTWGGIPAGTGPEWLKKPFDRWVKRWNQGDVMIFRAQKPRR
jgi:2-polyprenyl-3-methyl-5-hydroxy-6-metoxy-1,4-benzoquinol methylase